MIHLISKNTGEKESYKTWKDVPYYSHNGAWYVIESSQSPDSGKVVLRVDAEIAQQIWEALSKTIGENA